MLEGAGDIWRKDDQAERITPLLPGTSIDIPVGTAFQYRCTGETLKFICITFPPWPGDDEASFVDGAWGPTAPA